MKKNYFNFIPHFKDKNVPFPHSRTVPSLEESSVALTMCFSCQHEKMCTQRPRFVLMHNLQYFLQCQMKIKSKSTTILCEKAFHCLTHMSHLLDSCDKALSHCKLSGAPSIFFPITLLKSTLRPQSVID